MKLTRFPRLDTLYIIASVNGRDNREIKRPSPLCSSTTALGLRDLELRLNHIWKHKTQRMVDSLLVLSFVSSMNRLCKYVYQLFRFSTLSPSLQSMLLLFDSAEKGDGVVQTKKALCKDLTGQSDHSSPCCF